MLAEQCVQRAERLIEHYRRQMVWYWLLFAAGLACVGVVLAGNIWNNAVKNPGEPGMILLGLGESLGTALAAFLPGSKFLTVFRRRNLIDVLEMDKAEMTGAAADSQEVLKFWARLEALKDRISSE
jgi:hypothetical protein